MLKRFYVLFVPIFLASCERTTDGMTPKVIITKPTVGIITSASTTVVTGYAFDDRGVTALIVNGRDLLKTEQYAHLQNRKIVYFSFKTEGKDEKLAYSITAKDDSGKKSTFELPIRIDTTNPSLIVRRVSRDGNIMRVEGEASDNFKVSQVSIGGNAITITPAKKVPFYAEVSAQNTTVIATDAAGNTNSVRVYAPALPPPPKPSEETPPETTDTPETSSP